MNEQELMTLLMLNTMGESVLIETLRSAAYYVQHSSGTWRPKHYMSKNYIKEAQQCYFFIQGTALDIAIQAYQLDYDPDEIRATFNYCVRHSA